MMNQDFSVATSTNLTYDEVNATPCSNPFDGFDTNVRSMIREYGGEALCTQCAHI